MGQGVGSQEDEGHFHESIGFCDDVGGRQWVDDNRRGFRLFLALVTHSFIHVFI